MLGIDFIECEESNVIRCFEQFNKKNAIISDIIQKNINDMKCFAKDTKRFNLPKNANDENQYRILSFPWCIAGNILSMMKMIRVPFILTFLTG